MPKTIFELGIGTKKSDERANHYLVMAAEQNFAPAQHLLKHFEKAAEQNYIPSLISLGKRFLKDNAQTALIYFQKALEQDGLENFYEKWRLEKYIEECKKQIAI